MITNKSRLSDNLAKDYDQYIRNRYWYGPEFIFGLMNEFIKKDQKLLDIGIGTGLSSELFFKAGLHIYGVDWSAEMLKCCQVKGITINLKQADLTEDKLPFRNLIFDHVISHGFFHLVGNFEKIYSDVGQVIRENGIFGFSIDEYKQSTNEDYLETSLPGVFEKTNEGSGIKVYKYNASYINDLSEKNGFILLKKSEYLAFRDIDSNKEIFFSIYIFRKK